MTGPEITTMMGKLSGQEPLFFSFRLDDHVPADHLLRRVDAALDFGFVRRALAPYYSSTGRPSVDPELMLCMLPIGHLHGIRSERPLCDEVHLNLAYRWFCRLELDGCVPDHSTFSKNRHGRFRDGDVLKRRYNGSCLRSPANLNPAHQRCARLIAMHARLLTLLGVPR